MKRLFSIISDLVFRFPRMRLFAGMVLIFVLFSVLTVIFTQSDQVTTDPVGWEKFMSYSPAGVQCSNVSGEKNGNTVAIVYEGSRGGKKGIYVNVSFDGGLSFLAPRRIAEFVSQINNMPCAAISDSGEIRVAWYFISGDGSNGSMFQSSSKDLGVTWSEPEQITFGLQMEILPVIKYDRRNVLHLFFTAYRGPVFTLFHTTAEAKDGKFALPEPVAEMEGDVKGSFFPAVKFTGNRAAIVWQAKEKNFADSLYFSGSDDYGRSWSDVEKITPPGSNYQAPSIEMVDRMIYLVFMNNRDRNWGIRMISSRDAGEHWDAVPMKISDTNANCYSPNISLGPDNDLYITWHDTREKGNRIFLRKYSIPSRELSPETGLSVRKRPGRNAFALNTPRKLIVFWEEAGSIVSLFADMQVSAPVVRSRTHPVDSWTRSTDAVIEWNKPSDESGIAGYATISDRNPETNPMIQNLRYDVNSAYVDNLEDGITYFHIRAVDGAGNMSRTIHYKLQVSSNPLAMPVVVSTTHPEYEKSLKTDAVFRWAVNDARRLKGFVYSLSKGVALRPDKYVDDFNIEFRNLENGVYYFNIAAVSATNQVSTVYTYCFIVGMEGEIDRNYLKDQADRDWGFDGRERVVIPAPAIEILLPFGGKDWFAGSSFDAEIRMKNIPQDRIMGYSVVVDRTRKVPPEKINLKNGRLSVKDLADGRYSIAVKCRYFRYSGSRKVEVWSEPAYADFEIRLPGLLSPLDDLYYAVMQKMKEHPVAIPVFMLLFAVTVIYTGFSSRIVFYYKLLDFKIRYFF
ncbi:MAG TPA: sialidase family protein [Spirochaetota bacterium]|nr:sialidase family protein [Spirochaetota bacterium]